MKNTVTYEIKTIELKQEKYFCFNDTLKIVSNEDTKNSPSFFAHLILNSKQKGGREIYVSPTDMIFFLKYNTSKRISKKESLKVLEYLAKNYQMKDVFEKDEPLLGAYKELHSFCYYYTKCKKFPSDAIEKERHEEVKKIIEKFNISSNVITGFFTSYQVKKYLDKNKLPTGTSTHQEVAVAQLELQTTLEDETKAKEVFEEAGNVEVDTVNSEAIKNVEPNSETAIVSAIDTNESPSSVLTAEPTENFSSVLAAEPAENFSSESISSTAIEATTNTSENCHEASADALTDIVKKIKLYQKSMPINIEIQESFGEIIIRATVLK